MAEHVWLLPLKDLDDDARAIKLGEIAGLEVTEDQRKFVGEPLRMVLIGLEEESRHPFAIDANGAAVGRADAADRGRDPGRLGRTTTRSGCCAAS